MSDSNKIRLTDYAKGGGCGCKVTPDKLDQILAGHKNKLSDKLIIDFQNSDDAAIYQLSEEEYLVSTTDFFLPIVDDAYDFGAITATNSISDVYAMGGKPIMALAILGWPMNDIPLEIAQKVMQGAHDKCNEAGIMIAGGHTIESKEPFFGLAVNGLVDKKNLKKNTGIKRGDLLFITKPLGLGMIATSIKRNALNPELHQLAINQMTTLNKVGFDLGKVEGVNAMTDITGFGFLGHLHEMLKGSNLSAKIEFNKIPKLKGVDECIAKFIYPDMTTSNYNWIKDFVSALSAEQLFLLCDPQTSGGLMFSVNEAFLDEVSSLLKKHNCYFEPVGFFEEYSGKSIFVSD